MKLCPNGHEVSDMAKFCPKCGAEIQESVAEEVRFCKKCGNERKGTEKFCSHCGNPFNGDPINNSDNPNMGEGVHASSSNKKTIYLLVLVLLLLIGGYFVNNHIQEQKRLEKAHIEAAEEEQKRIEEEKEPSNIFYNIISRDKKMWKSEPENWAGEAWVWCLYFYPMSKNSGHVSVNYFDEYLRGYSKLYSCKVPYTIQDNYIVFTSRYYRNFFRKDYDFEDYMLEIQPTGNSVRLIRNQKRNTQVFEISNIYVNDPVKE